MPYARRRRFRRKKQPWYKKRYSAQQLAYKAWKATKYLKGLVNSEMLHHVVQSSLGANQSAIFLLNSMAQNDTSSGRTGLSILMRNYYIRGSIEINATVTSNTRVMMALVMDKQQIADTTPGITTIFDSASDPNTLINLANAGRFKVLYRRQYVLTPPDGSKPAVNFNLYRKCYKHVRFNGITDSDIQKNGLYLIFITSESANFPDIEFNSRIGYHDN